MANGKAVNWLQQVVTLGVGIAIGGVLSTIITRTNIVDQLLSPARSIWMSRTDDPEKLEAQEIVRQNAQAKKGFSSEELIAKGSESISEIVPNAWY